MVAIVGGGHPKKHPKGKAKPRSYWIRVVLIIAVGLFIGSEMHEAHVWANAHYWIYRVLQASSWQTIKPYRTVVVEITDDDYWKGEAARRVPIKRTYLSKLVTALGAADPEVIALDFQLRSPTVEGNPVELPDYQQETNDFLQAVKDVPEGTSVVLPASIGPNYELESTIYRGFNFGEKGHCHVFSGYIETPYDMRSIPVSLEVTDRYRISQQVRPCRADRPGTEDQLDSFSEAIIRAAGDPGISQLEGDENRSLPFGTYFDRASFPHVSASSILNGDPKGLSLVRHKIVLVGSAWHEWAYKRGPLADGHLSPMGEIQGVYLHANYVEAVLNHGVRRALPEWLAMSIEVLILLALAKVFALPLSGWKKTLWVVGGCLSLFALAYIFFQNFGVFFDFFIPMVLLAAHAMFDEIREWREKAHEYDHLTGSQVAKT